MQQVVSMQKAGLKLRDIQDVLRIRGVVFTDLEFYRITKLG